MSEAKYLYENEDFTFEPPLYKDTRKSNCNGLYQCTRCGKFKSKIEFYTDKRVPCGIRSRCKDCYHKK